MASLPTSQAAARSETHLLDRALGGEDAAFEAIMRRHNQRLFRLARSVLGDDGEAEEVVQEAYLRAFTQLDSLVDASHLAAWLGRIAINEALMRLRRRRPQAELSDVSEENLEHRQEVISLATRRTLDNPEAAAARGEIRRLLEAAIDRLPLGFRAVFVLRAIEEMSVEETAACLGLRPETVKTRLHRAKRALRRSLSDQVQSTLDEAFPFAGARCDRIVARVRERLHPADQRPS